ncbi:MAG: UDP-N-acetylmuramate dehydrogenase [Candidatus Omnitrophota bacterium]
MKSVFSEIRDKVVFDEPLSKHTTFRIGGPCWVWAEVRDEKELRKILKLAKLKKKRVVIIGNGSNLLAGDRGLRAVVIRLAGRHFKKVRFAGPTVKAGAGAHLRHLVNLACRRALKGTEGLAGIPGTLGGAIFMNAGYEGNISDCLESVRVMDKRTGKILVLKKAKIKFNYRHSDLDGYIILGATLCLKKDDKKKLLKRKNKLLRIKKKEQPLGSPSAGCVFKNPRRALPAARYIDMLGFKGKGIGGAKVSEKHANFIINSKDAKASDVLRLMEIIKRRVKSEFGVELTPEITIL